MIVENIISGMVTSLYRQRRWIVFCFLMFLSANSVLTATTLLDKAKYEQSENSTSENTKEENCVSDDDEKPSNFVAFIPDHYSEKPGSCFEVQECFLSFKPAIHLPPPEL